MTPTEMFEVKRGGRICQRMSTLCQRPADETLSGPEHDRTEFASQKFKTEAEDLAFQNLQQALMWPQRRH